MQTTSRSGSKGRGPRMAFRPRQIISRRIIAATGIFTVLATMGLVIYFQLSKVGNAYAASNGDYRSKATGLWSSASTWEKYNGSAWVDAATAPSSADGAIEIVSGHTVTTNSVINADQVTVNGTLTISSSTLTISNGSGTDLIINGTLNLNNTLSLAANASMVVSSDGNVLQGTTSTLTANSGSTINIAGIYKKDGGTLTATAGIWTFAAGSVYQHNDNGTNIPIATWSSGSTCKVTGITGNSPGNLDQRFYNFTWDCALQNANANLGGSMTVNGDFTIANTGTKYLKYNAGSDTMTVAGNYIQTGGTLQLSSSNNAVSRLEVAGNLALSGGTISGGVGNNCIGSIGVGGSWLLTGGTITVGGNPQSATEIVFNKSGVQSFDPANTTISGKVNFTVNSGTTLDLGTAVLSGSGSFTLSSGASLMISSTAGITSSGSTGTIQVSGTRSFSTGANYIYNGTAAQSTGNGLPSTVNNLTLNNSAGLTLTSDVTVSNLLTLTSGKIKTDSKELKVSNTSTNSIIGYSSSNYINGNLRRSVSASGSYDFPVGTASQYELINVNLSGSSGFSSILGYYTNANPIASLLPLTNLVLNGLHITDVLDYGYWTLTPNSSMTGGTYSVTLNSRGHSNAASSASNYCVLKRTNALSLWQLLGTQSTSAVVNGVVTSTSSALTSFSQFVHGYGGGTLPVELLYFNAKFVDGHVNLSWATASEINNDYFTIERSADGIFYREVMRKPGNGNSNRKIEYTAVDPEPLKGISYYRLRQTDYDGKFERFKPKAVENTSAPAAQPSLVVKAIGPNPFNNNFNINYAVEKQTNVEVQVSNSSGQTVFKETLTADQGSNTYTYNDIIGLTPGTYIVNLVSNDQVVTKKLIKQ